MGNTVSVVRRHRRALLCLFSQVLDINNHPMKMRSHCLSVQEELISRISYSERQVRKFRTEVGNSNLALRSRLSKAEAEKMKARRQRCYEYINGHQVLTAVLREIGDALAFTYLDKYDIKPMAFKPAPGSISGKRGSRLERRILRGIFDRGDVAILNDLTNCLRYGDITMISDGTFTLIEAKSGRGKNTRAKRQEAGLALIGNYIVNDEVVGLYGQEHPTHRVAISTPEKNYQAEITSMMSAANSDTYVNVENGLHYAVFDGSNTEEIIEAISRDCAEPLAFPLNELKHSNTGYLPFTLSIRSPDALLRFYLGDFIVLVVADLSVMKSLFLERGIHFELRPEDPDWPVELTDIAENGKSRLSRHFLERISAEFLSLAWFVETATDQSELVWSSLYTSGEPPPEEAVLGPAFLGDMRTIPAPLRR